MGFWVINTLSLYHKEKHYCKSVFEVPNYQKKYNNFYFCLPCSIFKIIYCWNVCLFPYNVWIRSSIIISQKLTNSFDCHLFDVPQCLYLTEQWQVWAVVMMIWSICSGNCKNAIELLSARVHNKLFLRGRNLPKEVLGKLEKRKG